MAKQRSDKYPFRSRFDEDNWQSPQQYLAEAMCDRQARKRGDGLGLRFWQHDPWKREFAMQAQHAASLLKIYDYQAVIRALRGPRGKTIYSLGAPFLDPLVKEEQARLDKERLSQERQAPPPPPPVAAEPPRPAFNSGNKRSILDKLRDLDG